MLVLFVKGWLGNFHKYSTSGDEDFISKSHNQVRPTLTIPLSFSKYPCSSTVLTESSPKCMSPGQGPLNPNSHIVVHSLQFPRDACTSGTWYGIAQREHEPLTDMRERSFFPIPQNKLPT